MGRIPTREVLDKMGIELNSTLCPRCSEAVESVDHALFKCTKVHNIWVAVAKWWKVDISSVSSIYDLLESTSTSDKPWLWEEVTWAFIYLIWSHRNRVVFENFERKLEDLFLDFQRKCFEWVERRIGACKIEWNSWLSNPESGLRQRSSKRRP